MTNIIQTLVIALLLVGGGAGAAVTKDLKLRHGETLITSIRFTPEGKRLASASFNGTVVMWDVASGERVWYLDLDEKTRTPERHTISHILAMDVSPDGRLLAVSYSQSSVVDGTDQADAEHLIALIDAESGQVVMTLRGHTFLIGGLAFSPDGASLLSVSGDETARLWDVKSGAVKRRIRLKAKGGIPAFSPGGEQFAIATAPIWGTPPQPIVGLYASKTGELVREFPRQYNEVMGMAFSQDGKYLLVGGFDVPNVRTELWDVSLPDSQQPVIITAKDKGLVGSYAYSPDGKLLAYGECPKGQPTVSVRSLPTNEIIRTYKLNAQPQSLAFSPDASRLAIGTHKGHIILESTEVN